MLASMENRRRGGRPRVIENGERYNVLLEKSTSQDIRALASKKRCSIASLIRAFVEAGLHEELKS